MLAFVTSRHSEGDAPPDTRADDPRDAVQGASEGRELFRARAEGAVTASVRACPVARRPPGQPSGSCAEGASSAYRATRARPGRRGSRRSRGGGASRAPRWRSGTLPRSHRAADSSRSTGDTRVSPPRRSIRPLCHGPHFPSRKPPRSPVRPPEFPQTRSRESPPPPSLTAPATPPTSTHSQTSSRAPAETTQSRAPFPPSPPRPRKTRSATRRTRPRSRARAVVTGRW